MPRHQRCPTPTGADLRAERCAAGIGAGSAGNQQRVFLLSDNVTLADEIKLKQQARARGLLVMGPDCGTAIVNGVGLGFANRVRRGKVGIVAASVPAFRPSAAPSTSWVRASRRPLAPAAAT
ncbi:MAG: hypothetical protein M9927_07745 [Anaerolineae bacterium]|nr:hypothetical protein [Anaerolineae bacterium]